VRLSIIDQLFALYEPNEALGPRWDSGERHLYDFLEAHSRVPRELGAFRQAQSFLAVQFGQSHLRRLIGVERLNEPIHVKAHSARLTDQLAREMLTENQTSVPGHLSINSGSLSANGLLACA
jgi:hypothetical protein